MQESVSGIRLWKVFVCTLLLGGYNVKAQTTNLVPVADTGLFEQSPSNNLGGMVVTFSGSNNQGKRSRALFKFDVASALPANATVTSASLTLFFAGGNGFGLSFGAHRILTDWGEGVGAGGGAGTGTQGAPANNGEASWVARFHPTTLWAAGGGLAGTDYVTSPSATAIMDTNIVFSSAQMAADVQMLLNNPVTNFGWMIIISDESVLRTATLIFSREEPTFAPVLAIQYTVPSAPAAPVVFNTALVGGNLRFSFNAVSNHAHVVEFRNSLSTGSWNPLTNIPAFPADTTVHITNAATGDERYFRVGAQ